MILSVESITPFSDPGRSLASRWPCSTRDNLVRHVLRIRGGIVVQPGVDIQCEEINITEALSVAPGSCVALIGGGGKTTAMQGMARSLGTGGYKVLITTTTKMWPPADVPLVCGAELSEVLTGVERCFRNSPIVALGDRIGPEGKVYGITPELVCQLLRLEAADVILCEADGSAGRSLKAHRSGEPIIPPCARLVLVVAGLDALGKSANAEVVHRLELFCRVVGVVPGMKLEPAHVALGLIELARSAPPTARVVFVLNKVDDAAAAAAAGAVTVEFEKQRGGADVLLLRHGRVVRRQYSSERRASPSAG